VFSVQNGKVYCAEKMVIITAVRIFKTEQRGTTEQRFKPILRSAMR